MIAGMCFGLNIIEDIPCVAFTEPSSVLSERSYCVVVDITFTQDRPPAPSARSVCLLIDFKMADSACTLNKLPNGIKAHLLSDIPLVKQLSLPLRLVLGWKGA